MAAMYRIGRFFRYEMPREREEGLVLLAVGAVRADDAPLFTHAFHPVPAKTNVLGAKGCGEAGCAGALPSVMNALVDALGEYGIRHIDMPATPERVWRAIGEARGAAR